MQASCVNEKNVLSCLEGMLFMDFFVFQCCTLCLSPCDSLSFSAVLLVAMQLVVF